jgi:hypothetical protein
MNRILRLFLLLIVIVSSFAHAKASDIKIDKLHLLLISNGHYIDASARTVAEAAPSNKGIVDFRGAFVSSMVVNSLFEKHIEITSSTLLRSNENRFLTKDDIFKVLNKVKKKIGEPEKGEYLLVYYVGHGFGEGIAWSYFLQPGNLELPEHLNSFNVEALAKQLVYVGYFNDDLKKLGIPYALLIDACYEGDAVDFNLPILSNQAEKNLQDVVAILKFMNEFRGNNPVIFSTTPGDKVKTVKHPFNRKLRYNIGPLARRLVLVFQTLESQGSVSIEKIVQFLKSSDLDSITQPAVSHADFNLDYHFNFRSALSDTRIKVEIFYGSAGLNDFIPLFESVKDIESTYEHSLASESCSIAFAKIGIFGKQGEFISDGKDHIFTFGIEPIELITHSGSEIVLEMQANGDIWHFSIAAPEGERLQQGIYTNVSRYPFQEGNQAGLEVSGAGRACNSIAGSLNIDSIKYSDDLPTFVSLSYQQLCDDETVPINGMMILELKKD